MPQRPRNYQAEYARRINRGAQAGLSRAQSRGHPRWNGPLGEIGRAPKPAEYDRRLEEGFKALNAGSSLTSAAKAIRVSPERLKHYLESAGLAERRNGKWVPLPEKRSRQMLLYSNGSAVTVTVDRQEASMIGSYQAQLRGFLNSNDPQLLKAFKSRSVTDTDGKAHPFETDPNTLYRLANTGSQSFEQIYSIVM